MGIAFSPATGSLSLTEFIGTTGTTVSILYEPTETTSGTVTITNVQYIDTLVPVPDDLVITFQSGGTSFNFSSDFDDMFYRVIKYLVYDADNVNIDPSYNVKTYLTANRFQNLPELYTGIWEFIPSPIQSRAVPFLVSYTAQITTTIPSDPETGLGGSSSTSTETGTVIWTFTIVENFQEIINRLLLSIGNGSRSITAKNSYPELNT